MLNYITIDGFYVYPSLFWPGLIILISILWLILAIIFHKDIIGPIVVMVLVGLFGLGLIASTTTARNELIEIVDYEIAHTQTTVTLVLNGESTVFNDVHTYRALLFPERYNLYWQVDYNAYGVRINQPELIIDVNPEWIQKERPIEKYIQSEFATRLRQELDTLNTKMNLNGK
jgi:hypothetical protein